MQPNNQAIKESDSFSFRKSNYTNTSEHNELIHKEFEDIALSIDWLANHRLYFEKNSLGFGDRSFHYMWYLLIKDISTEFAKPNILEIGVYKGQVLSAWALMAKHLCINPSITGITPLTGNPWWKKLGSLDFAGFIKDWQSGNFYHQTNYYNIIKDVFNTFDIDINSIRMIKGYSNETSVLDSVKDEQFNLIYIDGDHTFESVVEDLKNYSPLIVPNGFLVMDDASWFLPGKSFNKGHKAVSEACEIIPSLGFTNVLNIGHNRVFQKNL